jgi:hypothetical protein
MPNGTLDASSLISKLVNSRLLLAQSKVSLNRIIFIGVDPKLAHINLVLIFIVLLPFHIYQLCQICAILPFSPCSTINLFIPNLKATDISDCLLGPYLPLAKMAPLNMANSN